MRYLRVIGWESYQHYKNRRAPWIKAYTDILDALEHPTFTNLTDGAKLTLHHLRLLAGVTGNQIPETWITSGHLNMQTKPRVQELVAAQFVEWFELGALASTDQVAPEEAGSPRARTRGRDRAHSPNSQDSSLGSSGEGNGKKQPTGARELVESFAVSDEQRMWAKAKFPAIDVDAATDAWRDHFRSNGYKTRAGPIRDADAAWRNWIRGEEKFSRGKQSHGNRNTGAGRPVPGGGAAGGPGADGADQKRESTAAFKQRTAADVLARRKVHPVSPGAAGGPNDAV